MHIIGGLARSREVDSDLMLTRPEIDARGKLATIVPHHSIPGQYVTWVLHQTAQFRRLPAAIPTDQGPEFTGRALDQWAYRHDLQLKRIAPGQPTQNALIETFNGRFRDECLNGHWFETLPATRAIFSAQRRDYNEQRPHSALGYRTLAEFAAQHRERRASQPSAKGIS